MSWEAFQFNNSFLLQVFTTDNRKVKMQNLQNICKALFFGFTCSTFTAHLYFLFSIVTMDRNALSEPGDEFFLFQRRRNLPPALLAMSSPRLEPHHRPKKSYQPDFPSI
jgi:hypothetical protein